MSQSPDLPATGGSPAPTVIDLIEAIRRAAWLNLGEASQENGILYIPQHAYPQLARARNLGSPTTPEFDVFDEKFRVIAQGQGFAGGILANLPGQWADQHVKTIAW